MLDELVDSAFEYAYPLYAVAQTRYRAVQDPDNPRRHDPNTVQHNRQLSDHTSRWITAPNNDTLYSNAWIDLSGGPVRIRMAEQPPGRYWSLALMDAFTNHFAVVGQRLDGRGPVDFTLAGPQGHDAAPSGRLIHAPGNDAWLFCRWLVDGPEDLPNAHAMQDRLEIVAPPELERTHRVAPLGSSNPANFLAVVNEALASNPVPGDECELLQRWERVGLRAGAVDAWNEIDDAARKAWETRVGPVHDQLRASAASGRRDFSGWKAAAADIGNFRENYALRASVALGGLGALEPIEAMYFVRYQDDDGHPLDGRKQYLLRVPASGIPADSFWSFTMYEPTADGQRFFVANPINRYSIGNRTSGIVRQSDGSLTIALQPDRPSDPQLSSNWLPTPAGPFQIALRTYLPRSELRDGTAAMPTLMQN